MTDPLAGAEPVPGLPAGIAGWTTTRDAGSFGLGGTEAVGSVMARWEALVGAVGGHGGERLATAHQVHGATVLRHQGGWRGWLRHRAADGHWTDTPGTALAVTIADCTPVFIAHPAGAAALLHAGWRGTAEGVLEAGLAALAAAGYPPEECRVHLGPAICGACYEVGPEVLEAVGRGPATGKGHLDVRGVLAARAERLGVRDLTSSPRCTRCDNTRFFSHRAGDGGRQLGVVIVGVTSP